MINLKDYIKDIPNWPAEGVMFRDITGLLANPKAFFESCSELQKNLMQRDIDCIIAADARGFIWGGVLANSTDAPLYLVRKPGKLPPPVITQEYEYEYSSGALEIKGDIDIGSETRVGIIDDVTATGGTALAMIDLLARLGVEPKNIYYSCVIDLPYLGGSDKIKSTGANFFSVVSYDE